MKLYTRTHVAILGIVLSLCALAAGVLVTALVIVPAAVQRQVQDFAAGGPQAVNATPVQFTANLAPALKPGDLTDDELNNIQIYDRANKAVVYVTTVTTQYTWFYQAVQQEGTGSGVVIDQLGHVITNYHVINGADKISISLADGSIEEGKIVGTDPENDLAVLQFNPKGKLTATEFIEFVPAASDGPPARPVHIRAGQKFTLALKGDARHEWTLAQEPARWILRSVNQSAGNQSATVFWTFEAISNGSTQMTLRYSSLDSPETGESLVLRVTAAPGLGHDAR